MADDSMNVDEDEHGEEEGKGEEGDVVIEVEFS